MRHERFPFQIVIKNSYSLMKMNIWNISVCQWQTYSNVRAAGSSTHFKFTVDKDTKQTTSQF